jgi:2'-hydroxyisoflavone reductase
VIEEVYADRGACVRAGLIVGPHDPTDRFTYWPRRLASGGDVLAPAVPEQPVQFIDARDLAAFLVHLALEGPHGTFDATGAQATLRSVLEETRDALGSDATLRWTDEQPILDAGVAPWTELPLWLPRDGWQLMERDIAPAVAAGLTFRPLAETARDTYEWDRAQPGDRPTLTREQEAAILARA